MPLRGNACFGQASPTDAEIARAINEQASTTVATADDVRALRTGTKTFASPARRAGLSAGMIAKLNELVAELQGKFPGAQGGA
ncbi:hypothetical protein [Streptomyces orinoci]|uniref:Uncharacterized protein n=1 Tax=Streptomyces orinoci TaxID=67339 RepID=A0ABV3JYS4_STRON|nr:hypothetical protein [Streptomyces orinoci]